MATRASDPALSAVQERLDRLTSLLGPAGDAVRAALPPGPVTDADALRWGTRLRAHHPASLVADVLAQQQLRDRAAAKFTHADRMGFTRDGAEQASPEVVAAHRATRFAGRGAVADLCCGIGGDLVALALAGHDVLGVDLDPVHAALARHNAAVRGVGDRVRTEVADVRDVVGRGGLVGFDAVFVDPARRAGGRRTGADGEPPLAWCTALTARVPAVSIKAAPGVDRAATPPGWELEFVSVGRELKEAALHSPALATTSRRATLLPDGHTLVAGSGGPGGGAGDRADDAVAVRAPGGYLLDPDPAVTRAGLVEELARDLDAWKIDEQIAFLSADIPLRTPFARTLRVIDSAPWDQKRLPARLRALDIGAVDIRRRGLAGDVDALHRRLRLSGSRRATLVMTRHRDRPWALVCLTP